MLAWCTNCDQHLLSEILRSWQIPWLLILHVQTEHQRHSCRYGSLWLSVWLQRQINNKSDLNPSGKGSSSTWRGDSTSRVLNPLLVELFWGLHSFEMLILHETGRWEVSRATATDTVLSNTCGHATCTSGWRTSAPGCKAARWDILEALKISEGKQGLPWLCTALL